MVVLLTSPKTHKTMNTIDIVHNIASCFLTVPAPAGCCQNRNSRPRPDNLFIR